VANACAAYLQGALHDGTFNAVHRTYRFSQKGTAWLCRLQQFLDSLGCRSWLYQEGRARSVFVMETTASFLDIDFDPATLSACDAALAYVRGYFDAEGGIPQALSSRFYIQICQKDREELAKVSAILERAGIQCGALHIPSQAVAPDYWRFFVRTCSHRAFAEIIGSWHPRKEALLRERYPRSITFAENMT